MAGARVRFDPRLLTSFVAAADAGTISGASSALHLSQPAVTAQIRRLESDLGVQLFGRSATGVILTPEGRRFYERARHIQTLLVDAVLDLRPAAARPERLTLAASTTIAAHVLPPVLANFRRYHPEMDLVVLVGNTEQVLKQVTSGVVPLGLVEGHARAPAVRLERYVEDEIVLVGPPRLAPAIRCLDDLRDQSILWRERGSGTRAVVEQALRKHGFSNRRLRHTLTLGSTEAIKAGVIAGLGIAFVSRWAVCNECALGKIAVLRLADLRIRRHYQWTFPSGALVHPASEFYRFATLERPVLPALARDRS